WIANDQQLTAPHATGPVIAHQPSGITPSGIGLRLCAITGRCLTHRFGLLRIEPSVVGRSRSARQARNDSSPAIAIILTGRAVWHGSHHLSAGRPGPGTGGAGRLVDRGRGVRGGPEPGSGGGPSQVGRVLPRR